MRSRYKTHLFFQVGDFIIRIFTILKNYKIIPGRGLFGRGEYVPRSKPTQKD